MRFVSSSSRPGAAVRALLLPLAVACAVLATGTLPAAAQPAPGGPIERAPRDSRIEQRVERIHVEDGGSTIDERRYGGQTESITVQPKAPNVPAYEINPSDGTRRAPSARSGTESDTGQRVWRVLGF